MMRLHSYVVARDYGFAPNPFFGICTLATCKPRIRKAALIGDWVVGTGSKRHGRHHHVVYAMRVTGSMSFDEYWNDPRFQVKKPNLRGSLKQAFGDNIYHHCGRTGTWCQADSHHSFEHGTPNPANIKTDTSTNRVLYSDDFCYWGGSGPKMPAEFLGGGPEHLTICAIRNHRNDFSQQFVKEFIAWFRSLDASGFVGEPLDW